MSGEEERSEPLPHLDGGGGIKKAKSRLCALLVKKSQITQQIFMPENFLVPGVPEYPSLKGGGLDLSFGGGVPPHTNTLPLGDAGSGLKR